MTSIDDLFKKPHLPSNKRKLDVHRNSDQVYKSAKPTSNGDVKGKDHVAYTIEEDPIEENDGVAGPELPPDEDDAVPDDEEGRFFGSGVNRNTVEVLNFIDERDAEPYVPEKVDASWVRKMALNFEKKISRNAELRVKFESDPPKFMASEADLDTEVKALSILAQHPELYGDFAKLGCVSSLISLLSLENTDIAIDAIEVISELIDEDVEAEQTQWSVIVDAMLESDLLGLLVQNFERFDESEEPDRNAVYHALSIIEGLASQASISNKIGQETSLFKWLLARMQRKESPVGQNKQYAAEVLAILLQSSTENRKRLAALDGVDLLLQLLSAYRKRDPEKDSNEEEYVENVFDALTCMVDEAEGKRNFVDAEGVELCLIMLREGKMSKSRALRLLDHALGGTYGAGVCERLVDAAGLKTIFGMFMKRQDNEAAEHLLGIFAALLRLLPGESASRIRTLAKFVEKDYEKIAKILKMRREYATKVATVNQQIQRERATLSAEDQEEIADKWFSRRLDAGLYCLQTIDVVLVWLAAEDDGARRKIVELLAQRGESLNDIKSTLQEQLDGLQDTTTDEEQASKDMLSTLILFVQ
ncbi:hypothetical protein LTR16_003437 [Cryomyces antarcticus]|uniref:Beta-catenin-like protein 1 N-terminal domain-containing protein n=1 Tax=Cryomyces antarcticus TaxID=329879 RepID=A0ABR0KSG8_9PEZI|nr:hypothetical protein LTR16_003437 [Cryomyces antarcticus]